MGLWKVQNKSLTVNMTESLIKRLKKKQCSFCWIKDNPGIADEENTMFYCDKNIKLGNQDKKYKGFKDKIQVCCANGTITLGTIVHWVRGPCVATPLRDWFIICPN